VGIEPAVFVHDEHHRQLGRTCRPDECDLFDLICSNDLEGIVAKRLADPYDARVRWLKVKNRDYSQAEGRGDLFNGPRHKPASPSTAEPWNGNGDV
jgi:hypothetical protein